MKLDLSESSGRNPYVEISFRPSVATIDDARRFVRGLFEPLLGDAEFARRIAMATHELLESALQYSLDSRTLMRVELSRATPPSQVTIETRNRISMERKEELEQVFAAMKDARNAQAFYDYAIEKSRHGNYAWGRGLARIWREGEMMVSRSYTDDEVRILAVALIPQATR